MGRSGKITRWVSPALPRSSNSKTFARTRVGQIHGAAQSIQTAPKKKNRRTSILGNQHERPLPQEAAESRSHPGQLFVRFRDLLYGGNAWMWNPVRPEHLYPSLSLWGFSRLLEFLRRNTLSQ